MHTKTRTIRQRRRRATAILEAATALGIVALAGWSGSLMKRSVAVPPAAQIDRIEVRASETSAAAVSEAPIAQIAASPEASTSPAAAGSSAAAADPSDDQLAGLPTELAERLRELQSRGVITNEVRVETLEPQPGHVRFFDGRAVRPVRKLWMTVTAYSPDERSCGIWADGITASNKSVWTNAMQLVAADTRLLPFGTLLSLDDYADGQIVPVLDRGGAIKGMRLDVLYATHAEARQFGVKRVPVTIWEYVD